MKLNCLVIDDEPVARKGIVEYVGETDFLALIAECEDPVKASAYFTSQCIDLVFLDIQMPRLSGIDFLKTLTDPPLVIFTTAYPDYALEGYALDVVDYLLKPVQFERFLKAAQKAYEIHRLKKLSADQARDIDYFFVKVDNKFEKIIYSDLHYIESLQNYVVLHIAHRKVIAYMTLAGIERQLPEDKFLKVHKSYIVGIDHVKAIEGNTIHVSDKVIPISRTHKEEVVNKILGNRLLRR